MKWRRTYIVGGVRTETRLTTTKYTQNKRVLAHRIEIEHDKRNKQ
jgi:hypothetical protein